MNTSEIKVGLKFKWNGLSDIMEVIKMTDTRVVYSDGDSHCAGASNRRMSSSWMTLKGFSKKVKSGRIELV